MLTSLLRAPLSAEELISFGRHFTTSTTMAMVVGRRVLGAFVSALSAGLELDLTLEGESTDEDKAEVARWAEAGAVFSKSPEAEDVRRTVVEQVLQPELAGWCEEQTTALRHAHAAILMREEEWLEAARALMKIPLDGGSR
jgi:COP9 signalosome complex subunit 4